jgi:hypothetical protein
MPPVPPRGSSRAIQGNASEHQQYQSSNQGYRSCELLTPKEMCL